MMFVKARAAIMAELPRRFAPGNRLDKLQSGVVGHSFVGDGAIYLEFGADPRMGNLMPIERVLPCAIQRCRAHEHQRAEAAAKGPFGCRLNDLELALRIRPIPALKKCHLAADPG